ncbi:hypothetical protein OAK76_02515 [Akkermansiaceae bacterium]|nr:hypothetical protein [Akkermansiaceae bacterium]
MNQSPYTAPNSDLNTDQPIVGKPCPTCEVVSESRNAHRNKAVLVFVSLGFSLVIWIAVLFLGGFIIGIMNSGNPEVDEVAERFGEEYAIPAFFFALVVSILLTVFGKLPGARK